MFSINPEQYCERFPDRATTWHYEFDARGNQIRQAPNGLTPANGEIRYTFNQANQLIRIEKHNGTTYQTQATALYDGDGYRRQTEAYLAGIPFTNTYAVDVLRDGLPLTVQNSLMTTQILYGLFGVGEYQDNDWLYYQGDASLSVRQMTDEYSQIVLAQTYAPYGNLLRLTGEGDAIFGFAGSQAGGLNLLYGGQRYFDPETGRYLTPDYSNFDPKHPSRGLNPYTSVLILAPLVIAIGLRKRKGSKIQWYVWLLLGTSLVFTLTACERPTRPDPDGTETPDASERLSYR